MEKGDDHGDLDKRRPYETTKLSTNLFLSNAFQTIFHDALQQIYAKLDSFQFPDQAG